MIYIYKYYPKTLSFTEVVRGPDYIEMAGDSMTIRATITFVTIRN